jgi:hypothetical protein
MVSRPNFVCFEGEITERHQNPEKLSWIQVMRKIVLAAWKLSMTEE